jgi:hypothetical protein
MKTVGMCTRITSIELPYLKSFIDYHQKIGVNHFSFVCNRHQDIPFIKRYLKGYKNIIVLPADPPKMKERNGKKWLADPVKGKQNKVFNTIKTDYVINFDADEYLILRKHETIQDFVQDYPKNTIFRFKWVMAVNDENKVNVGFKGFNGHICDVMVKRSAVHRLNEHSAKMKQRRGGKRVNIKEAFCLHHWARSFNDVVLRSMLHEFQSKKKSTKKQLIASAKHESILKLPARLKILGVFTKKTTKPLPGKNPLRIDKELEEELIKKYLSPKEQAQIRKTYGNS